MTDQVDPGPQPLPPAGPQPLPPAEPSPERPAGPPGEAAAEAPAPPPPPVQPLPPASMPGAPTPAAQQGWAPAPPVQSGSGRGRWLACCLAAIALVVILCVVALVGLIFLGAQVSSILSTTGQGLRTPAPLRAVPTTVPAPGTTTVPAPGTTAVPIVTLAPLGTLAPVAGSATPGGTDAPLPSGLTELPHQAPEVEALAPTSVNGLPLTTWSVKGDGWLEMAGMPAADGAALRQAVAEAGGSLDDFASVISGRSDVKNDPPYFVYVYRLPGPAAAVDAALPLVIGTAGWKGGLEPDKFETRTIGGKQVFVGTEDMLGQSEHQRGRPYWYEIDDKTLAIVITDQEAWATDALSQLP